MVGIEDARFVAGAALASSPEAEPSASGFAFVPLLLGDWRVAALSVRMRQMWPVVRMARSFGPSRAGGGWLRVASRRGLAPRWRLNLFSAVHAGTLAAVLTALVAPQAASRHA